MGAGRYAGLHRHAGLYRRAGLRLRCEAEGLSPEDLEYGWETVLGLGRCGPLPTLVCDTHR